MEMSNEERVLREKAAALQTERLDAFRALVPTMRTSDLILYTQAALLAEPFPIPKLTVEMVASSEFHRVMKEHNEAKELQHDEVQAAMFAVLDEIDRRLPIPLNTERSANACAEMAQELRRSENDETVQDCEYRIDRLCTIVYNLALIVRGAS